VAESPVYGVPRTYVDALVAVDAAVVVIPPVETAESAVARLDGLVLSGGADVEPSRYGATTIHPAVKPSDRDDAELAVLRAALACGLPVLGVCRGVQLLTVHFGGALHQHLPDALGHDTHCPGGEMGTHRVRFAGGTALHDIYGASQVVNSFHHQGIADTGALVACGWAEDGLVEAVRHPGLPLVLGVQWHPEKNIEDRALFRWFANQCADRHQVDSAPAEMRESHGHRS
jgi:putative glutamine amidotransferase